MDQAGEYEAGKLMAVLSDDSWVIDIVLPSFIPFDC